MSDNDLIRRGDAALAVLQNFTETTQLEAIRAIPAVAASQPSTVAARWRANGQPDPHGTRYDCERAALSMGDMSDDELANRVFMANRTDPDLIIWQTAAKDRIRWLSRALESAAAASPPADPARVTVKPLVWRQQSHDCYVAETAFGSAAVQNESHALAPDRWGWWMVGSYEDDSPSGYAVTIELAKAAAQADYEARILAAIDVQPADPVTNADSRRRGVTGWVIANGQGDRWRCVWKWETNAEWTDDISKALKFATRDDAEAFSADDEDAWLVQEVPIAAIDVQPAPRDAQIAALVEALKGIDQTETDSSDGWWETSFGAQFGAARLRAALAAVKGGDA